MVRRQSKPCPQPNARGPLDGRLVPRTLERDLRRSLLKGTSLDGLGERRMICGRPPGAASRERVKVAGDDPVTL